MFIAKKMLVLTIGLAASSIQAHATPIFSLSSFSFVSSADEHLTGDPVSGNLISNSSVLVAAFDSVLNSMPTFTTVVTLAPTTKATGIASTYRHYTSTTTHTAASYTDKASFSVSNATPNTGTNLQFVRMVGIVTANAATTLTYQMTVDGPYMLISGGRHGGTLPGEVGLWFNEGPTALSVSDVGTDTSLTSSRVLLPATQYRQSSGPGSITMAAGEHLYVVADVETSTLSGIKNFAFDFTSAAYGGQVQVLSPVNVDGLYLTSTLAIIAEPATPAMFLAGLGIAGMLGRRKKTLA